MGTDKKKQVNQLLVFVKHLYDHPDYNEFAAGIRSIVLNDEGFLSELRKEVAASDPETLRKIETYLSLDFQIDAKELPDYGFIVEDSAREKLLSDYREMLRYRFGTRNHKIDFPEFCRYALLQIEMLVNYFYDKKYDYDITAIQEAIKDGNYSQNEDRYYFMPNQNTRYVYEIGLSYKIQALQSLLGWTYNDIRIYLYISYVRNNQSHRSLHVNKDLIRDAEDKLKAAGAWSNKYNTPDYKTAGNVLDKKTLGEYKFQIWLDKQPFQEVTEAIKNLADAISASI